MTLRVSSLLNGPQIRQFVSFFGSSAVGLIIDLLGFQALLLLGLEPWTANAVSSTTSITAVYFLVTRYSFGTATHPQSYVAFVAWYGTSIILFSILIQLASSLSGWPPISWKLLSVPISFGANYLFSRYLFKTRQDKGGS